MMVEELTALKDSVRDHLPTALLHAVGAGRAGVARLGHVRRLLGTGACRSVEAPPHLPAAAWTGRWWAVQ